MKTINFTTDGYDYVVVVSNISYITPNLKNGGTIIELTSGTKLFTKISFDTLTDIINKP